jgi:hypothetical protein
MGREAEVSDTDVCRKCSEVVAIRDGQEHTGFCDQCAQEMISDLVGALEAIQTHEGLDQNNCAMKPNEWREHLQEMAGLALDQHGLTDQFEESEEE